MDPVSHGQLAGARRLHQRVERVGISLLGATCTGETRAGWRPRPRNALATVVRPGAAHKGRTHGPDFRTGAFPALETLSIALAALDYLPAHPEPPRKCEPQAQERPRIDGQDLSADLAVFATLARGQHCESGPRRLGCSRREHPACPACSRGLFRAAESLSTAAKGPPTLANPSRTLANTV